jgi:hypothetical protein
MSGYQQTEIVEPPQNRVMVAPNYLTQPTQHSAHRNQRVATVRVKDQNVAEGVLINKSLYDWYYRTKKLTKQEEIDGFELYDQETHGPRPVLFDAKGK